MSLTKAENYKSSSRDFGEDTQRGAKPRRSSRGGAGEEGYRKGDYLSTDTYEWKDSPYTKEDDSAYIDRYVICYSFFFSFLSGLLLRDEPPHEPPHDKTNKMTCAPSEDSDQMGIRPVWTESSLFEWRNIGSSATNLAHCEDSDPPRLIWVFAGRTDHFVGFVVRCSVTCR